MIRRVNLLFIVAFLSVFAIRSAKALPPVIIINVIAICCFIPLTLCLSTHVEWIFRIHLFAVRDTDIYLTNIESTRQFTSIQKLVSIRSFEREQRLHNMRQRYH